MRINKYIALSGIASRRNAEILIKNGDVTVNGRVCLNLATDITEDDSVSVKGKVLLPPEEYQYYMLNKPKGYVSTVSDDKGRKSVIDLIKTSARIFPVGRLDYQTEGLLILTNDGDLTYHLTHPKNNVGKTYVVKIEERIEPAEINLLRNGVTISGGVKLRPAEVRNVVTEYGSTRLEITIFEGKNREIRRMFEAIDKNVTFLKRTKIGDLKLGGLNRGEYRELTYDEVEYLKNL